MIDRVPAYLLSARPAAPEKLAAARAFRRSMTPAESRLWAALRGNRLNGLHFRRQQVIAGFVLDFYCHPARLAVEVDGSVHNATKEYDGERDKVLAALGIRVLRFNNDEVDRNLNSVLARMVAVIDAE